MLRIIFHVGPPKTGTSLIQNFLNKKRAQLLEKGIYYPQHYVDTNGVSHGNRDAIYSEGRPDTQKLKDTISKAKAEGAQTLLLSSEAFYVDVVEIHAACPQAEFILYLRQPLQNMESYYNQAVKRSRKTDKFSAEAIDFSRFVRLQRYIESCGLSNFIVRYYQKDCFKGGNLLSDFLQSLQLPLSAEDYNPVINPSYTLAALEFKRRVNHLPITAYADYQLDRTLQNCQIGMQQFSLTPPEIHKQKLEHITYKLNIFLAEYNLPGWEEYLERLASEKPKPYHAQELSDDEANEISRFILENNPGLYAYLARVTHRSQKQEVTVLKKSLVSSTTSSTDYLFFLMKDKLSRLRQRFH